MPILFVWSVDRSSHVEKISLLVPWCYLCVAVQTWHSCLAGRVTWRCRRCIWSLWKKRDVCEKDPARKNLKRKNSNLSLLCFHQWALEGRQQRTGRFLISFWDPGIQDKCRYHVECRYPWTQNHTYAFGTWIWNATAKKVSLDLSPDCAVTFGCFPRMFASDWTQLPLLALIQMPLSRDDSDIYVFRYKYKNLQCEGLSASSFDTDMVAPFVTK